MVVVYSMAGLVHVGEQSVVCLRVQVSTSKVCVGLVSSHAGRLGGCGFCVLLVIWHIVRLERAMELCMGMASMQVAMSIAGLHIEALTRSEGVVWTSRFVSGIPSTLH